MTQLTDRDLFELAAPLRQVDPVTRRADAPHRSVRVPEFVRLAGVAVAILILFAGIWLLAQDHAQPNPATTPNHAPRPEKPPKLVPNVLQTLPDGTKASLPRGAETAKARKIISFRATDGSPVYLWLMPYRGGGDCIWASQATGCSHTPAYAGRLEGGRTRVLFFDWTEPEVATIELRYQNGERERLTPIDGFVLHEITPAHYRPGTRLVAAVALSGSGKAIGTQRFHPQDTGLYPCKNPVNQGYGVKSCP